MALAMGANAVQLFLDLRDAAADLAAVSLQLRFAGATQTNTTRGAARAAAGLSGQVSPHSCQARQAVLQLGQFDLQLALSRPGVLAEDVEDQGRPINDLDFFAENLLQLPLMAWRKLVIENDHVGL